MKVLKQHHCFGGTVTFNEHDSDFTKTKMNFSTFKPNGEIKGCLIWLSGLTCTDENFMTKASAHKYLSDAGLMVICPDTSPRGLNLPGEHESSEFGSGAGFYVDATTQGYKDHYKMYSYIAQELHNLIQKNFSSNISIFGHSMGGHGALILGLNEKNKYKSVSAFAPIVNPVQSPWGQKAFAGYLGNNKADWEKYDACQLLKSGLTHASEILIDQGTLDPFLAERLLTKNLIEASAAAPVAAKQKLNVRFQEGYDHSYYFISTFIADHIKFHAKYLS